METVVRVEAEPEFARRVRALFDAHRHIRRDPRFALHSATVDPVEGAAAKWPGEAKISGRAIASGPSDEEAAGDRFHAEIAEVVHTHLNEPATMLVVEWWTPTHGLRTIERE